MSELPPDSRPVPPPDDATRPLPQDGHEEQRRPPGRRHVWDRIVAARMLIAVALASLIIGAVGAAGVAALVHDGDDDGGRGGRGDRGHGRMHGDDRDGRGWERQGRPGPPPGMVPGQN